MVATIKPSRRNTTSNLTADELGKLRLLWIAERAPHPHNREWIAVTKREAHTFARLEDFGYCLIVPARRLFGEAVTPYHAAKYASITKHGLERIAVYHGETNR